ncbi:DUF2637 domain-containing protein [Micromonospora sp. NPDC048839]|uniref:DUF2637 domain-containing protein n=1 Tax=Micromonospora sp. NPDC048839 TaxID=3155641 RepID=UPI0033E4F7A0
MKEKEKPTATERAETTILVLILLAVGGMAMASSFTHVHDFTMKHSPADLPDWFGWANAVITELTPTAALLEVRRCSRRGKSIRFPMWVLIGSTLVSLTANLALAIPSLFGWMVAGLPALAFAVLTKMVLSGLPKTDEGPASVRVQSTTSTPAVPVHPLAQVPPVPVRQAVGTGAVPVPPVASTPAVPVPVPVTPVPVPVPPRPAPVHPANPVPTEPAIVIPGPARRTRKAAGTATDEELLAVLGDAKRVPRDEDGTVPVRRAAAALGTGPDRARRLLDHLGLRTPKVPVPA